MTDFVAGTLAWMLIELILTGLLFVMYFAFRQFLPVAADRFRFLKLAFTVVVFLPWLPIPWGDLFSISNVSNANSMVAATVFKIRPVVASSSNLLDWIPSILVGAYLLAASFFVSRLIISLVKLRRIAAQGNVAFEQNGIEVRTTDNDLPPATFGFFCPIILIPQRILNDLSETELKMILQHEMYHIKRRDYFFNLIKASVQAVLVFSPFIHKLSRTFVEDMELSCDAQVISHEGYSVKDYGGLLLRLTAQTRPRTNLVYSGLFVSNSFISRRISSIRNLNLKARRALSLAAFGVFGVIVGPTVSSLGLNVAVDNALSPKSNSKNGFAYEANLITTGNKKATAAGALNLYDGKFFDIQLGSLQLKITPQKISEGWKFAIEVLDPKTNKIITSASIITDGNKGAQILSRSDNGKSDDDIKSFSLNLTHIGNI